MNVGKGEELEGGGGSKKGFEIWISWPAPSLETNFAHALSEKAEDLQPHKTLTVTLTSQCILL